MARIYLLTIIFIATLGIFLWHSTFAYFVDATTSTANTFTVATEFPTTNPDGEEPLPGKVVINEVNPIGGNSADWIELYNIGGTTVDLSGWKIQDNSANPENIPGNFSLAPNAFAVIVGSGSATSIPGSAAKIELSTVQFGSFGLAEAGDKVILLNSSNVEVDAMSYGENTDIFNPAVQAPFSTNTIRRISNGVDTDTATDWAVGASSIGISN